MSTTVDFVVANLGWLATAVFTASYFCKRPEVLRAVQMAGAALWLAYGVAQHAPPVIVANALVLAAAGITTWRARRPVDAGNGGLLGGVSVGHAAPSRIPATAAVEARG